MRITGRQLRRIIQEEVRRMVIKEAAPLANSTDLGRAIGRLFDLFDQADPEGGNPIITFSYQGSRPTATTAEMNMVPLSRIQATVTITKETAVTSTNLAYSMTLFEGTNVQAVVNLRNEGKVIIPEYVDMEALDDVYAVLASEFPDFEAGLTKMLAGKSQATIPVKLQGTYMVPIG